MTEELARSLDVGIATMSWLVTAYLIAIAALQPIGGTAPRDSSHPPRLGLTDRDARLLAMLAQGRGTAAWRVGAHATPTPRNGAYRVGVSTRFQMGVQAVRIGLLPRD